MNLPQLLLPFQPTPLQLPQEQYFCFSVETWTLYNHLLQQQQRLLNENTSLTNTLHDLTVQLVEGRTANDALSSRSERKVEKRRYRLRREGLEKKYGCPLPTCSCKYSSKIALNCHMRKKHPQNE